MNLPIKLIIVATLITLYCPLLFADTKTINDGCLKYLATGKVYRTKIQIVDGGDLWPKYSWANVLDKYAIVFWSKEEAVVINLGAFGFLMDTGNKGKDLNGKEWEVAKYPWC